MRLYSGPNPRKLDGNSCKDRDERRVQIRVAGEEDIEELFSIRTSVHQNYQSREELASIGVTPASVAEMLRKDARAWICEMQGAAAGFAMADAAERTIFGMFVRPEFEGRGIGRMLMSEAERWLFNHGFAEIWLTTGGDTALRANGFYRHLGWTAAETLADGQIRYVKSIVDHKRGRIPENYEEGNTAYRSERPLTHEPSRAGER